MEFEDTYLWNFYMLWQAINNQDAGLATSEPRGCHCPKGRICILCGITHRHVVGAKNLHTMRNLRQAREPGSCFGVDGHQWQVEISPIRTFEKSATCLLEQEQEGGLSYVVAYQLECCESALDQFRNLVL
jgi:hypothetical protein